MITLQFLGATRTVTGSKYLVGTGSSQVLVDCGLFQGFKELRLRNWEPLPLDPAALDAVVLTHAHIDHSGYLPRLVTAGYGRPVYASHATCGLCRLLLPDSGRLQEEDARYANRKGFSKHTPALPLYTEAQAKNTLQFLRPVKYAQTVQVDRNIAFCLGTAGHILGSAFIHLTLRDKGGAATLLFSGDLGRYDWPILVDPESPVEADYVILESTYGDRLHGDDDPKELLAQIVNDTVGRGGSVVIPAFAVGRTQELLYLLVELREARRIPETPIYVDSPMAIGATAEYLAHPEELDPDVKQAVSERLTALQRMVKLTRSQSESRAIMNSRKPAIILSASGMATGGRILHHLAQRLPDPRNTILFVGFQAAGTRGRTILDGAQEVKIHGHLVAIRAQVVSLPMLSAHADYAETLRWLRRLRRPPRRTYLVHGEPPACVALRERIRQQLGWEVEIPDYAQTVALDGGA